MDPVKKKSRRKNWSPRGTANRANSRTKAAVIPAITRRATRWRPPNSFSGCIPWLFANRVAMVDGGIAGPIMRYPKTAKHAAVIQRRAHSDAPQANPQEITARGKTVAAGVVGKQ